MRLAPTRLFVAEAGCLWWARPEVQPPPEPENSAMRFGKAAHREIELAIKENTRPIMPEAIAAFEWQVGLGEGKRFSEGVIGYDPIRAKATAYPKREAVPQNQMCIIVDFALVRPDDPQVWDWKTGNPNSAFDYSPQVFSNAMAVATLLDIKEPITAGLAYLRGEEPPHLKSWQRTREDSLSYQDKLRSWAKSAPIAEPNPGPVCRYCPARKICPTQTTQPVERGDSNMQPTPAPASPGKMSLTNIVRGRIQNPPRVMLYGVEKIGKSSFAAKSPNPIFLCAEDGTAELDVARLPEPHAWSDALAAIELLRTGEHEYKTLVVDTLDWLEPLCWRHVCKQAGKTDIEAFGFGKGYIAALDEWRVFLEKLDTLRRTRRMGIILLAHSWIRPFKNPDGDDYDRHEMKLHAKSGGLIKEWADAVLFATYEVYTHEQNGRAKGVSTGARIVHTQRRAAWDAGNRYDLPETIPLDWDAFADGVASHRPADPSVLKERIGKLLESVKDEKFHKHVTASVSLAKDDAAELSRIENKLSGMLIQKAVA